MIAASGALTMVALLGAFISKKVFTLVALILISIIASLSTRNSPPHT